MNATRINNRKAPSKPVVQTQTRRLRRQESNQPVPQPEFRSVPQRVGQHAQQPVQPLPIRPRVDAPDPHRALARVRTVRGQRVLLERDLASALGTLSGRLADLAMRHADWFPETARFSLSAEEAVRQGLWYQAAFPPLPPVVYTADGLIAAAHWLSTEAARAGDPYAECADLSERFRLAWAALDPDRS